MKKIDDETIRKCDEYYTELNIALLRAIYAFMDKYNVSRATMLALLEQIKFTLMQEIWDEAKHIY